MSKEAAKPYSQNEELANVITHAIGVGLAIAGLALLMVLTAKKGDSVRLISCAIYSGALILLYGGSAFYHGVKGERLKAIARVIDHSMIYVLIAGTYTPYTLVTLRGAQGWTIFAIVWSLAVLGVICELAWKGKPKWVSLLLYLAMGWTIVVASRPLLEKLGDGGFGLLVAGGITYTVGTIFYVLKRVPYMHTVWHLFVLGGSICHYLSVALYVA